MADAAPTIDFELAFLQGVSGPETSYGASGVTFVLRRTGVLTDVSSVNYTVVGSGGDADQRASAADFLGGAFPNGVLTFAAGESVKTLVIGIVNDSVAERDENFIVLLSNAVNATINTGNAGLATILNDDTPPVPLPTVAFASTSATVIENVPGGGLEFVVTRTGGTAGVSTVSYSVYAQGVNAATAADFAGGQTPSGSLTFAAGETSKTIRIGIVNDNLVEADERFSIVLSNPNGAVIGAASMASAVIGNDDSSGPPPVISFSTTSASANEGSGVMDFVLTRTGDLTGASTVTYSLDGQGVVYAVGADFVGGVLPSGNLTFAAGESVKTLRLNLADDSQVEPDRGFVISLSNPIGAALGTTKASGLIFNDDPTTPMIAFSAGGGSGDERSGADFYVRRTGLLNGVSTVAYTITAPGNGAADAADFAGGIIPSGTITFAPGESSKVIHIDYADDAIIEPTEQYLITLSSPTGAALGTTKVASGWIGNNDFPPELPRVMISYSTRTSAEGGSGFDFVLARNGDASGVSTVTYKVSGYAVPPSADASDFLGGVFPSGTVTFAAGETVKTLHIDVLDDDQFELDEEFILELSNPIGATLEFSRAIPTIINDDRPSTVRLTGPSLSMTPKEAALGATGMDYVITRFGDLTRAASVEYAVKGGGYDPANAADFKGGVFPKGVATFAPGQTTVTVHLEFADDNVWEFTERYEVFLSNAKEVAIEHNGSVDGWIGNDDMVPVLPTLSIEDFRFEEGTAHYGSYVMQVRRVGDVRDFAAFSYSISGSGSSPTNAADFSPAESPVTGSVTFGYGQATASLVIPIQPDSTPEADETFTIALTDPWGVQILTPLVKGTVVNDDGPTGPSSPLPVIEITTSLGGDEASLAARGLDYTLTRTGNLSSPSTVRFAVTGNGDRPASGADFAGGLLPSGTVTFAAGEASKTIHIGFIDDKVDEGAEAFQITLSNPGSATLGKATALGAIANDDIDAAPKLSIQAVTTSKAEGSAEMNPFEFVITRTGAASGTASVDYTVAGSGVSPTDLVDLFGGMSRSGSIDFAPGEVSQRITVYIRGDLMLEPNETFTVTLSNAKGAGLGTASATATVLNDDTSALPMISIPRYNLGADENLTITYTLYRSGDLSGSSTVDYAVAMPVSGNPPVSGADFVGGLLPQGTLTFVPGQASAKIYLNPLDDFLAEPSESFRLLLSNPTGATLGDNVAFGSILNSDATGDPGANLSIVTTSATGTEGGPGLQFTVMRLGATNGLSSVRYSVAGSFLSPATASDFAGGVLPEGVITFATGETTKTIHIALADDALAEGDESFALTLMSATGGSIGIPQATGVIRDNDQSTSPGPGTGPGPSNPGTSDPGPNNPPPAPAEHIANVYETILRSGATGGDAAWASSLVDKVVKGELTEAQAIAQIVPKADATTSVASLAYQFFTGSTPTAAGFDYLVAPDGANPNNLNSAYYQSFGLENRYINFAVNLGKLGAGKANFEAQYGAKDLFEATKAAYTTIFGAAPTDAKVHLLLDASFVLNGQTMTRAEYFAYYGQDGVGGIGTKAAMVGWLLAEAEKADIGVYAKSNAAFLADLADGAAYGVDIVGVYGQADYAYVG